MQCLIEVDKIDKRLEKAPVLCDGKVIGFCHKIVHNDIIDKDMVELYIWDDVIRVHENNIEFDLKQNEYKDYWEWRQHPPQEERMKQLENRKSDKIKITLYLTLREKIKLLFSKKMMITVDLDVNYDIGVLTKYEQLKVMRK